MLCPFHNFGITDLHVEGREITETSDFNYLVSSERVGKVIRTRYFAKGIDTQLGTWFNQGIQLSGGQWQRIALARSFIKNADLCIYDELSSSLDIVSEYEIFQKASNFNKEKISVFTSHRLYNLKKLNPNIIVLKDGELIENGVHNELMYMQGHYSYLYNLQNKNSF